MGHVQPIPIILVGAGVSLASTFAGDVLPVWVRLIGFWLGILLIAIGVIWYTLPFLTAHPWWRGIWLSLRYPTIRVTFSDWLGLSSRKEMAKSVGDRVIWTEPEYRVTGFDFAARSASSRRLSNFSGQVQSLEAGKSFPIHIDAMPPDETYGVPARVPFRINVRFPRSTPEQEGWTIEDFWRHMGAFSITLTDGDAVIFHTKISETEVRRTLEQQIEAAKFPMLVGHRVEKRRAAKEVEGFHAPAPPAKSIAEPPKARLAATEVEPAIMALGEIERFLATQVAQIIHKGRVVTNWRHTLRNENHEALMNHIVTARSEKDRVSWELKRLIDKHSYFLGLLGMDFSEIAVRLDRWHAPIQDLISTAELIPNVPTSARDNLLNPKVHDFTKEVSETENLVNAKRKEISEERLTISPA